MSSRAASGIAGAWGRVGNAVAFLAWERRRKWLSEQEKALYRLPTEAEWENACRAGTITRYSFGDNYAELEKYAWYNQNAGGGTHPVGTKLPNAFGLHDMHGNLFEWCQDVYDERWYEKSEMNDPSGPAFGTHHVLRGGGWFLNAAGSSSTYRNDNSPLYPDGGYGFRCVREFDVSATTLGSKP